MIFKKKLLFAVLASACIIGGILLYAKSQTPTVRYEELIQMSDADCYDKLIEIGFMDQGWYSDKETAGMAFKVLITEMGKENGFIPNYVDQDYMHAVFTFLQQKHISFPVVGRYNHEVYDAMLNLETDSSE